jgi:hypothetical protein
MEGPAPIARKFVVGTREGWDERKGRGRLDLEKICCATCWSSGSGLVLALKTFCKYNLEEMISNTN